KLGIRKNAISRLCFLRPCGPYHWIGFCQPLAHGPGIESAQCNPCPACSDAASFRGDLGKPSGDIPAGDLVYWDIVQRLERMAGEISHNFGIGTRPHCPLLEGEIISDDTL